jgi:hypothetical protein
VGADLSSGLLTQVKKNKTLCGDAAMATARYHRDQAELCLEMARQMSAHTASDWFRAAAARHFDQAIELEKLARPPGQTTDKHQE